MSDGQHQWLASAWLTSDGAPKAYIRRVAPITVDGVVTLVEHDDGQRIRFSSIDKLFSTQEQAELYCADALEKLAARIVVEIARLREQAAARVAAGQVVGV